MATISLPELNQGNYLDVVVLQDALDTIVNLLNGNIDNDNIGSSANISPSKIDKGGAVVSNDLTTTGEAGKIPQIDASGDLTITGKLVFEEGLL